MTWVICPKCGCDYDDPDFDESEDGELDQCCDCDTAEFHQRQAEQNAKKA